MRKVYLGGPIAGLTYAQANGWREAVALKFADNDIHALFPVVSEPAGEKFTVKDTPYHDTKGIVVHDRLAVMSCDVVLMNLSRAEKISIGCCVEFGWADILRKPVVTILNPGYPNPHEHPFINEITGFFVYSIDEAVDVIVQLLV